MKEMNMLINFEDKLLNMVRKKSEYIELKTAVFEDCGHFEETEIISFKK